MSHNIITVAFAPEPPICVSRSIKPMSVVEIHKLYADTNTIRQICHLMRECILELSYRRGDDVCISMPEYFALVLERYLMQETFMHMPQRSRRFGGVEILPHYYNEIVIFNKYAVDSGIDPFIISLDFKEIKEP